MRRSFHFHLGNIFVALALASVGLPLSINAAEPLGSQTASEIRAVLAAQVKASNRGDVDCFMRGYDRSRATEFGGLSGVDLEQEATEDLRPARPWANVTDASQLYKNCLTIQNAAPLQFPSTKTGNENPRARYLLRRIPAPSCVAERINLRHAAIDCEVRSGGREKACHRHRQS